MSAATTLSEQQELQERGWRFHFRSDDLALNFVATVAGPVSRVNERLTTPALLAEWLQRAGLVRVPPLATEQDLVAARELREAIARLTAARVQRLAAHVSDVAIINHYALLRSDPLQLSDDGQRLRVLSLPAVRDLLGEIARDAVSLFGGDAGDRVRQCASPNCPIYFVDNSRGQNRRWCSKSPCADQASAREYRARKRAQVTSTPKG